MRSNKPFSSTLAYLLDMEDISGREFARRCSDRSGESWGSHSTISRLLHGTLRPSAEAMKVMATELRVDPETFAEYRMWKIRHSLDPSAVRFESALKSLQRIESLEASESLPAADLARELDRDDPEDRAESA